MGSCKKAFIGMIPVVLDVEGLSVRLAMRADGRVYAEHILRVRAHLKEGADGVVELVMGEIGPGGPERLILDRERGVFRRGDRSRSKDLIR